MTRNRVRVVVAVVAIVLMATPGFAGKVLDRIVERGEIRVGMSGNQPPMNLKSKSGALIGFEVDLVTVLAASMGVEPKLVGKPFPELLPALASGELDIVVSGVTITPKRNTQFAFVGPYMVTGKSILTKSKSLAKADEADDINDEDLRLGALEGSTSARFVQLLLPKATLVQTRDYDAAVKMLMDDKIDAIVADMEMCLITAMRYPDAGLVTLDAPLTLEPIGIAVPPNDALLVNLIENYLGALTSTGLLEELQAEWYEDGAWLLQMP